MAQPPVYNRLTSFANLQALNPSGQPPGNSMDAEFNAVKTTLDAVLADLALIQNDDTTVKNASIGPAQLSSQLTLGFTAPRPWLTATAYTASPASTVIQSSKLYIALVSHTSGTFATDLAAGKWLQVLDLTAVPLVTAAQIAVTPSGLLTTDAQTSLQALDTGKAASSHTHIASQISDSTTAGRAFLTAVDVPAQQTLLGLGALAFLNSVAVTAISAQLAFTGKIAPAALVGNTNDWSPTGLATAVVLEVSAGTPLNITGVLATSDGDIKILDNVGTNNITLLGNNASSAAANRLALTRPLVLRPGQSVVFKYDGTNTIWRLQSPLPTNPAVGANFKNLVIGNGTATTTRYANFTTAATPDTQFVVTYDELVLEDANGETWRVAGGNHTISTATTAAINGLESAFSLVSQPVFVWVLGNPTTNTVGALLSLSATAPTKPSGYTFAVRVGATFTDASSHLLRTIQLGRSASYLTDATHVYPTLTSGSTGTITGAAFTGTSVALAATVPMTAWKATFLLTSTAVGVANLGGLAPNSTAAFSGTETATPPPLVIDGNGSHAPPTRGELVLESGNVFYAAAAAAIAASVLGWEDNI